MKWTDASKKLPPKNSKFLVFDKNYDSYKLGLSESGNRMYIDYDCESGALDYDHNWSWMKLPPKPRDKEC